MVTGADPVLAEAAPLGALLVVDDDPDVVAAVVRSLRPNGVRTFTANSGEEAIAVLEANPGKIGGVLTDFLMDGMNGAELLHTVRTRWPAVSRVLLTGNADVSDAARAVNEGQIQRLLTKPWSPNELSDAVRDALEQHRLLNDNERLRALADEQATRLETWAKRLEELVGERTAELERANVSLSRGVLDSVRLMVQVLEWRVPERAAECREVAKLAGRLAERSGLSSDQVRRIQVAALVHDVGLLSLPDAVLKQDPRQMSPASEALYERHPVLGHTLLSGVEQLADMASWIRHHHERWDGLGYPDHLSGNAIPLPSRLIALANSYYLHVGSNSVTSIPWQRWLKMTNGCFDPELVQLLANELNRKPVKRQTLLVDPAHLQPGMVLSEPMLGPTGMIYPAGMSLTADLILRVRELMADGTLLTGDVSIDPSAEPESAAAA